MDELTTQAIGHGRELSSADRHPHAGGPLHQATYSANSGGFEVEWVAVSS